MADIVLNKRDTYFKFEVAARPGAHNFSRCFSCGTCTASCPVSEIEESFNPRMIIRRALLGEKDELLASDELWYCAQCYTCYARCPQDVRFTDILAVLRQMAVENGHAPRSLIDDMKTVDLLAQKTRRKLAGIALDAYRDSLSKTTLSERTADIASELEAGMAKIGHHE